MRIEDTSLSPRHYWVDPKVVELFRRWKSEYARESGANEADFHSFVFNRPELVTCVLGEEQSIAWRKETTLSTKNRLDLVVLFYGRSQYDLIECKGPSQPIIKKSETTRYLDKSLNQLAKYRKAFSEGRASDHRFRSLNENPARLILIGDVDGKLPVPDESALLKKELESRPLWRDDFERELLIVTTWDMVLEKALEKAKQIEEAGVVITTSRWCNNVVKDVLGNFAWGRKKRISLPSIDEFMARASGRYELQDSLTLVEARAKAILGLLRELQVSPGSELDTRYLNGQLQLADWMLYEGNGDMPIGQWEHRSTADARDILTKSTHLWTAIIGRLLKALAKDSSEDVLGRTSHVLRYAPEDAKKLLLDDRPVRDRWRFPDPETFATEPLRRPALVSFIHLGYCLAHHGDSEAIVFMNRAAATPHVVNDVAQWNTLHAKQNPENLVIELRKKAEKPTKDQKAFLPWHKAILEATESMLRQLTKCRLS